MAVYFFNVLCYSFNRTKMFTCYEPHWQLEPKGRQYAIGSFFVWINIQGIRPIRLKKTFSPVIPIRMRKGTAEGNPAVPFFDETYRAIKL